MQDQKDVRYSSKHSPSVPMNMKASFVKAGLTSHETMLLSLYMFHSMKLLFVLVLISLACLESTAKTYQKLPLYGNLSFASYFFEMMIGTPPQKQQLILDTGSSLMTVKCGDCTNCQASTYPNYEPESSPSSKKVFCNTADYDCLNLCRSSEETEECTYRQDYYMYLSGTRGLIKKDKAFFSSDMPEKDAVQIIFGCATSMSGVIAQRSNNGIFGMAPYPQLNKVYEWFNKNNENTPKVVSICLAQNGGYLQLGTPPEPQPDAENVVYSTFINNYQSLTTDQVTGLKVGELDLFNKTVIQRGGVSLDTGSTLSHLPQSKFELIKNLTDKICSQNMMYCKIYQEPISLRKESQTPLHCYIIENPSLVKSVADYVDSIFPHFDVVFEKTTISTKPSEYFLKMESTYVGLYCIAIKGVPEANPSYLLGSNWFINKKVILKLDQASLQIRPNSDCTYRQPSIFAYKSRITVETAASYLGLVAVFLLLVLIPYISEKCANLKGKIFRKQAELVEQSIDKQEQVSG